jgi:hypothetical protein
LLIRPLPIRTLRPRIMVHRGRREMPQPSMPHRTIDTGRRPRLN